MTRSLLASSALFAALAAAAPAQAEWSKLLSPAELQALAAEREIDIVDIRASAPGKPDEKGEVAPTYAAGHIPGSVNAPYGSWRGTKENPGLRLTDETVVTYCNTGHSAATDWFALSEIAGLPDVRMYPESMVDWTNAGLPVAPGK